MDQTQREFLIEIEELVEHLFADLDELRSRASGKGSRREVRELIDRIFRTVHSVKGSAAASGLDAVSRIAHELESVLDALRLGRINCDAGLLDTLVAAAEALGESLSLAASGGTEPSHSILFDRLSTAARGSGTNADTEAVLEKIPPEIWQSLNDPEKHRLVSVIGEGSLLFVVETSFDITDFDQQFYRLKEKLAEHGEIVSTSPTVDEKHPEKINFRVLYASEESIEKLEASVVDFPDAEFAPIAGREHPAEGSDQISPAVSTFAPVSSLSNFVRTDLDKLDRLISSTDELFRITSKALGLALLANEKASSERAELGELNEQIRKRFRGVENELINLRMVSLEPTLQRATRAGRAAARLTGKEIDFEITGGELRIDKLIADAIADPLLHLVRNAVDHGIESAAAREEAGKSSRGRISIRAVSEGSQTRVRVMDDGRGIDPVEIADAANRLGLASGAAFDSQRIDIEHGLRLIFRPGFTTLDSSSEVSGRGVGLDVVETAIEQVGGELRVSTEPARGTTFEIRLPVTFGLLTANVVVSAGIRYCIPADQTLGIDAIDVIDGSSGANQLRQFSMRDLLGQPEEAEDSSSQFHMITCRFTDERAGRAPEAKCVGIVVDRVEGPQEVLVRNLGRHAGRWYGIAGGAHLRDGTVALVLDLPRLISGSPVSSS
ncbi:MAG: Hpt domain-containing protein [Pyrinomonadaceae bacterium]|nr:Hpt domain-containing protein [Pyrinomonadaceae bacterium]